VNGIDVTLLIAAMDRISNDPDSGQTRFSVRTTWQGRTRTETSVEPFTIDGERHSRPFRFSTDEPHELLGEDRHASPVEYLLGALNACMLTTFAIHAALRDITLDRLEIEAHSDIDLRGLLGLDDRVPAGCDTMTYTLHVSGSGTPDEFRAIHELVMRTSPSYFGISNPVKFDSKLVVE